MRLPQSHEPPIAAGSGPQDQTTSAGDASEARRRSSKGLAHRAESGSLYDNKQAFITIKAGSIVRWNYKDTGTPGCNQFNFGPVNCPGHEVRLENGTPGGGRQIGFAAARSSKPTSISWYIPPSYAGRTIHYFCNINNHWAFGLTGVLVITR